MRTSLLSAFTLVLFTFSYAAGKAVSPQEFELSSYLGLTHSGVSAVFRNTAFATNWSQIAGTNKADHPFESIHWGYNQDNHASMSFWLEDGRVVLVTSTSDIMFFDRTESQLNRTLTAINDHQWVEPLRHAKWTLTRDDKRERCILEVARYSHGH